MEWCGSGDRWISVDLRRKGRETMKDNRTVSVRINRLRPGGFRRAVEDA